MYKEIALIHVDNKNYNNFTQFRHVGLPVRCKTNFFLFYELLK